MAKDGFDVVTDIRGLINVQSVLLLLQGGKVDPSIKTTGASKRGIVVNVLGITNAQDQIGFGNINCYAPAIISTIDGKSISLPDQATLSTLAKAIEPLIDDVYTSSFRVWIKEEGIPTQDTDGSYFASIQFGYQSIQDNFKRV